MIGKIFYKKFALTLAVILLFLASNTALAYHHHALDNMSHHDCPICATAHVSSSAVHDFSTPAMRHANIAVSVLTPHEHHVEINPIFLTCLNNRAPPC
jgi:hypothetical protein